MLKYLTNTSINRQYMNNKVICIKEVLIKFFIIRCPGSTEGPGVNQAQQMRRKSPRFL